MCKRDYESSRDWTILFKKKKKGCFWSELLGKKILWTPQKGLELKFESFSCEAWPQFHCCPPGGVESRDRIIIILLWSYISQRTAVLILLRVRFIRIWLKKA